MRTLANHCYDVRFQKPPKQEIVRRLAAICRGKGMKLEEHALDMLIESMGNDLR